MERTGKNKDKGDADDAALLLQLWTKDVPRKHRRAYILAVRQMFADALLDISLK